MPDFQLLFIREQSLHLPEPCVGVMLSALLRALGGGGSELDHEEEIVPIAWWTAFFPGAQVFLSPSPLPLQGPTLV